MTTNLPLKVLLALPVLISATEATSQKKHKLKPTVQLAKTWDAALDEAKLLKVPIVVHLHEFY